MNTYQELRKLFIENSTKEDAQKMAHYMQDNFPFYGVTASLRKSLTKPFISQAKKNKCIDWELLNLCYEDSNREMQYFVNDYLMGMQKYLTFADVPTLTHFASIKQWWDTIDFLDKIIGTIGDTDSRVDEVMLNFSKSENMWLRRLAIDHQQARKERTNKELLEQIILNNLNSDEFFINKAIGWSLRDFSLVNPLWVKAFVEKYHDQMSKLSIKEATKFLED